MKRSIITVFQVSRLKRSQSKILLIVLVERTNFGMTEEPELQPKIKATSLPTSHSREPSHPDAVLYQGLQRLFYKHSHIKIKIHIPDIHSHIVPLR